MNTLFAPFNRKETHSKYNETKSTLLSVRKWILPRFSKESRPKIHLHFCGHVRLGGGEGQGNQPKRNEYIFLVVDPLRSGYPSPLPAKP